MTYEIHPTYHPKLYKEVYQLCVIDEKDKVKLWLTRKKELSRNYRQAGFLSTYEKCSKAMAEIEKGFAL